MDVKAETTAKDKVGVALYSFFSVSKTAEMANPRKGATLAEIQQGHQVRKSLLGYTAALMGTCLRQAVLHLPTVCSAGGIPYLSTSEDLPGGSSGCSYTIAK